MIAEILDDRGNRVARGNHRGGPVGAALYEVYSGKGGRCFRKTGRLLGLDGKTVKHRLLKAGYIVLH